MSTRCNVSSLIQIFCFLLLHYRCSSADSMIDCFSSFHLSPTLPCLFLVSKHSVKVLRKFALAESSCRSLTSKRLPCFSLRFCCSFNLINVTTKRWSLSLSAPLQTLVSRTDAIRRGLTRMQSLRLGALLGSGGLVDMFVGEEWTYPFLHC